MFANAEASPITFHIDIYKLIDKIRKLNMKVGVAISPKTPIIDIVLIMAVESKINIGVDGDINNKTAKLCSREGVKIFIII